MILSAKQVVLALNQFENLKFKYIQERFIDVVPPYIREILAKLLNSMSGAISLLSFKFLL